MTTVAPRHLMPAWLRPAPDSMWRRMQRTSQNPKLHLLNFLWSLWVLATLFFTSVDAMFWWTLGIGYLLFTVLFVLVHVRPEGEMRLWASLIALVAFVSMFWNPSAWSYAVFACVYVGMGSTQAPSSGVMKILMIQAVLVVLAWWLSWPWFVMLMAVCVCSSSGFGAMFGFMSQQRNLQLRQSHEEIRRLAASTERERIGRDLHDLLGHTLSLITLKLELSRKLFDRDHDAARRELEEAEKVARNALAEVRAAVTGIRATGLAGELASARLMLQASGVTLECPGQVPALPVDVDNTFALVLREAVTNIHRHARARQAEVAIVRQGDKFELRIADNGRGGASVAGNGTRGMRERVLGMAGTLRIESPPGGGTRVRVELPVPQAVRPATTDPEPVGGGALPDLAGGAG